MVDDADAGDSAAQTGGGSTNDASTENSPYDGVEEIALETGALSPRERLNPMLDLPRWVPRLIVIVIFSIFATLAAFWFFQRVRTLLVLLVISLFLSFALEPGVNWLNQRGWRRGPATGVMFLGLLVLLFGLVGAMVPLVVGQVGELIERVPEWLDSLSVYTERWFDFELTSDNLVDQLENLGASVSSFAGNVAGNLLGFGAAVLTAIFQGLAILLFTFYLVADGPRVRRAVCSVLRPERQAQVLSAWNIAIDKTGGYLYSRLLLAIISGAVSYVVLLLLGVEYAAALALWLGFTSQFIPTVGTYIGALLPLLVAVIDSPLAALIFLIYVVIYQQIENYLLSPRITAHTMELHPAVAFGAAIAGASVMGAIGAFLALPAAAIIQAGVGTYIRRHDVVETNLTREQRRETSAKTERTFMDRVRGRPARDIDDSDDQKSASADD